MNFKYRYVEFGTRFISAQGSRSSAGESPDRLYDNELALDVGGACWGIDGETRPIVDHHFFWPERFPSAAAAVLHRAEELKKRFDTSGSPEIFWLITHRQPDFDAFASMYLARCILDGSLPHQGWTELGLRSDGWWRTRQEIDWYHPDAARFDSQRRWAILLAACASCVDNCRPMSCPRHRAIHSVLYAAMVRGRNYLDETSGAMPFFTEVRRALSDESRQLNPLYDSVLEQSEMFAPELALLDRQTEAYEQDMKRARRTVVYLQRSEDDFSEWYARVSAAPLFQAQSNGLTLNEAQLLPSGQRRQQADGIYIRDPECLLFKEWVRNDVDHSSMGEGFLFSGVAYSDSRPGATVNTSAYFFALDPERAAQRHIYNLWARLQASEVAALAERPPVVADGAAPRCRPGYEGRAGEVLTSRFDDPWFDGANYDCTIVVAPSRGTVIGPAGVATNLVDDPVAQIVERELELSFLSGDVTALDFPTSGGRRDPVTHQISVIDALQGRAPKPQRGTYRFGKVELDEDVEILQGTVGEQVGRLLWRLIDVDGGAGVPTDFLQRHLVRKNDWVAVWSRQGVVVAAKKSSQEKIAAIERLFRELANLASETEALIHRPAEDGSVIAETEGLIRRAALVRHELSLPDGHVVRRFFDASRLDEVLSTLRDLSTAAVGRRQAASDSQRLDEQKELSTKMDANIRRVAQIQSVVHFIEYLVAITYSVELWEAFFGGKSGHAGESHFHWILFIPAGLGLALVMVINYVVEGHWVEWHWIKSLFGGRKSHDDTTHGGH
ncbi:MAG: hypothetical protein K8T91_25570 [Planctomycetes bacterium]|nr:hypothetical protein [Planctomycetota bacterium]